MSSNPTSPVTTPEPAAPAPVTATATAAAAAATGARDACLEPRYVYCFLYTLLFTLTTFYRLYYYQTRPGSPPKANAGPRSLLNAYSPTLVPQSLFDDAMSPFGTSPYATSLFYDRSRGLTSPTYSPMSPGLNLTSLGYSPTSPRYLAFIFTYVTSV